MENEKIIMVVALIAFAIWFIAMFMAYDGFGACKDILSKTGELILAPWRMAKRKKAEKEFMEYVDSIKAEIIEEMIKSNPFERANEMEPGKTTVDEAAEAISQLSKAGYSTEDCEQVEIPDTEKQRATSRGGWNNAKCAAIK